VEASWKPIYTARDLGEFLADLRRQHGWSQAHLARELGVTRQYVSEIESGKPGLYNDRLFGMLRLLGGGLRGDFPS